jgi:KamA family protein
MYRIEELEKACRNFFRQYGTQKLLGKQFFEDIKPNGRKEDLFDLLVNRCGFENNFGQFFKAIFSAVSNNGNRQESIEINTITIPPLFFYHILETVFPGTGLYCIKTADQLDRAARISSENKENIQKVIDMFPVRLSDHVIRQSLVSKGVADQYLPFEEELDPAGDEITFDGHLKKGVLEQMYSNRVIFLLDMHCPVYCRFCFRKHKSARKQKTPDTDDVKAAVNHVRSHPKIREILITGGEPLVNRPNLDAAVDGLVTIDHVRAIRIATRSVSYYPDLFLKNRNEYIDYLVEKNALCLENGKYIEIGIHFVHPDEVSVQSIDIISQLVKNGVQVYVQTPFLKGLNTEGRDLGRLFELLRQAGAQIYYIFTPCSPIHGTKKYWASIADSFRALKYLRENFSDRAIPKLCTATPIGKIEWNTSGWAVEKDEQDKKLVWIRTPYTNEYFEQFMGSTEQLPLSRINAGGTLDAGFRIDMGDDTLFRGKTAHAGHGDTETGLPPENADIVRNYLLGESELKPSIEPTLSALVSRVHKTRVEMKPDADKSAIAYVRNNPDITDVVIIQDDISDSSLEKTGRIMDSLKDLPHVICARICCRVFNCHPEKFTFELAQRISEWCDFSAGDPFRIEVETWFILPEEITHAHARAAQLLIGRGINVYANVPLIAGVNDRPELIENLAHALREARVEFHHFYVAGLAIQDRFNGSALPDADLVVEIASRVRRNCSGRQIPLYIVQTGSGETDFGF